jgi:tetratricopeptide (TPR) repeat protein
MELSAKIGDKGFLAELMSAKAWIAILRETDENLRHAKDLLKSAWNLNHHCTPYIRSTIALNLAVCYTRCKQFEKADYWFIKQHKKVVQDFRLTMSKSQYNRLELRFLLYFAERFYRNMDYGTAFKIYQQVVKKADAINWLRFKVKAFERMAYLYINDKQYGDAREILDTWYPVMKRNHDIRRMAFFQRDYAELEFQLQNFAAARRWAIMAQQIFSDLGMEYRSIKMEKYISS